MDDNLKEITMYLTVKAVNFNFSVATTIYEHCFYQCLNKVDTLQLSGIITPKILNVVISEGFIRKFVTIYSLASLLNSLGPKCIK